MEQFVDQNGHSVRIAFQENTFNKKSNHVLVICQHNEKWLLTSHKERGWEFPGGKMEPGETPIEAARREVFEETGALLETIVPVGEYEVSDGKESFVKAIFFATVREIIKKDDYLETNGPVFEEGQLLEVRFHPKYSFIMKDDVVKECLKYLNLT